MCCENWQIYMSICEKKKSFTIFLQTVCFLIGELVLRRGRRKFFEPHDYTILHKLISVWITIKAVSCYAL